MSRWKWNAREFLSALQAELDSPETQAMVAEEMRQNHPLERMRQEHGEDWMDEEQADWEAGL